jgi:dihydrofolate reductase
MGRLIYLLNVSLDGFVATADGGLEWTVVDDELHAWFNEEQRSVDASLYGRGMYELMSAHWPTAEADPASTETERAYARLWNATPKLVFSRTLESVAWNSRLVAGDVGERLAEIRREHTGDLEVSGPTLAAQFIERDLVDEYRMVVHPVILGSGKPYLPALSQPIRLRFLESRTFGSGAVALRYEAVR